MTVNDVVAEYDRLRPNAFSPEEKFGMISVIDSRIFREIIQTHFPNDSKEEIADFTPYSYPEDQDKSVLADDGFIDLYVHYIAYRYELANGETVRAQNEGSEFNYAYRDFSAFYNRTHKPKGVSRMKL